MDTIIIVPRTLGGTLILTIAPAPPSTLPTLILIATFRDGNTTATHRDGNVTAGGR